MLIDGVRLNNSVFRSGPNQYWNTVDGFSLDRIEVQKGPGAVLYGSDGIGGVVNTISTLASLKNAGWSGQLLHRYASAENSNTSRAQAGYGDDALRVRAGVTYKNYGDLEGGSTVGLQPKNGYDERDANMRVEYDLNDHSTLIFAHQYVSIDDAWRAHRTIYGVSWEGTTVGTDRQLSLDQKRNLTYLQLHQQGVGVFGDSLQASLSFQRQEEDQFRIPSTLRTEVQGFDVNTRGVGLQITKQTRLGLWVYGFDYYRDDIKSYRIEYNVNGSVRLVHVQGPVADDASYDLAGAFLQDRIDITPRLNVTLGARYTYAAAKANNVESPTNGSRISLRDHWANVVGSARFGFAPLVDGPWLLFAGASQGFRAPNISDLTRFDIARSGQLETPQLGLDPEKYNAFELGAKVQQPRWSAQLAYFYTQIRGQIVGLPTGVRIGTNNEVHKFNGGDGNVHGVEAQITAQLTPQWGVHANAFWLTGELQQYPVSASVPVTDNLDMMMPATFNAGLQWQAPGGRWSAEAVMIVADRQDKLSAGDKLDTQRIPPGGTPGYTVFNLRGRWQATPSLSLSLGVDNLTDRDFRVHGSGVNEPGRNVIATLSWKP
jgi:hemoglobin/transferrin/lactoferrin receptor protein